MKNNNNKKLHGQFYTTANPFANDLFMKWFEKIKDHKNQVIIEPFAGSNNIVQMVGEHYQNKWACFDIEPNNEMNKVLAYPIIQNDSLLSFPTGFNVAITNPPYLAKNSATRDGLPFPDTEYDDLYKYALSVMLKNVGYAAAIIPESFTTQNLFHDRLFGIATLNCRMFDDTECPVCLAMFIPEEDKQRLRLENDFHYYKGNVSLGYYSDIQAKLEKYAKENQQANWKFNVPSGEIGLYAIDSTKSKSIRFVEGEEIAEEKIKHSSRGVTRITGVPIGVPVDDVIKQANKVLDSFRTETSDLFLTSFRGLRQDGDYRRRLDFTLAKMILNRSVSRVGGSHA